MPRIDGILYDEMWGMQPEMRRALAARKLAWETEFNIDGIDFVGSVIAKTEGEATLIADARGLGEKVIGLWREPENA